MFQNEFLSGGLVLVALGAILAYFRRLPDRIWGVIERNFIVRLDIQEDDESFHWLKIWFTEKLKDSLSVSVFTRRRKRGSIDEHNTNANVFFKYEEAKVGEDNRPQVLFTPAPGVYWMKYKGRFVFINCNREDAVGPGAGGGSEFGAVSKPRESFSIRLFTRNRELGRQLVEEARDFALPQDGRIEVRTARHGYWTLNTRISPRAMESVILDGTIGEELLHDVRSFLKDADWYTRLGIPYRRGYLLYGEPGGGKSSIVLAIASALNMGVNVLNLSAPGMNDATLNELLAHVGVNSIVLIEDIDCAFVKRNPNPSKSKLGLETGSNLTFSGILNALDGLAAQEGRIIFMTTNHVDKLDEALVRPGRVDYKLYIGNATANQAERLYRRFYPAVGDELVAKFLVNVPDRKLSMAALQGYLQKYKDDPIAAAKESKVLTPKILSCIATGGDNALSGNCGGK